MNQNNTIIQPGELRRQRIAAGLSAADLAELAGVNIATLSRHENGKEPIPLRTSNSYRYALIISSGA